MQAMIFFLSRRRRAFSVAATFDHDLGYRCLLFVSVVLMSSRWLGDGEAYFGFDGSLGASGIIGQTVSPFRPEIAAYQAALEAKSNGNISPPGSIRLKRKQRSREMHYNHCWNSWSVAAEQSKKKKKKPVINTCDCHRIDLGTSRCFLATCQCLAPQATWSEHKYMKFVSCERQSLRKQKE